LREHQQNLEQQLINNQDAYQAELTQLTQQKQAKEIELTKTQQQLAVLEEQKIIS